MSSRRQYLSIAELEEFANISVTNTTEAYDQISQAEELIDAFVGYQERFICEPIYGKLAQSNSTTSHLLQANLHQNTYYDNYFKLCEIEIIGGTGEGQRKKITASTYAGYITTDAFSSVLDSTSEYVIYQLGKFPRECDVYLDTYQTTNKYYPRIPENIKRAVAAQVQFMIQMGTDYFATDKYEFQSESIGNYSYTKGGNNSVNQGGLASLIAPKAKLYLKGFVNRKGKIVDDGRVYSFV